MGPLQGLKVVELAGAGPAPFCAMLLSDMGADVLRIDRVERAELGLPVQDRFDLLRRGRRSVALDLKSEAGLATTRRLIARADVLIEGFRPGVTERLGIGPDACMASNPRLVYARVTGWGQEGPLSSAAGHDINYIALAGVLGLIGPKDGPPIPPLGLVGDYGGGGLYLAFGIVSALLEARDWQGAHEIAQESDEPHAAWAHGIVHIIEGDEANARYWYDRAGRAFPGMSAMVSCQVPVTAERSKGNFFQAVNEPRISTAVGIGCPAGGSQRKTLV